MATHKVSKKKEVSSLSTIVDVTRAPPSWPPLHRHWPLNTTKHSFNDRDGRDPGQSECSNERL
jgi:hypothetical protein